MKEARVQVPVCLTIWSRMELQKKQFEVIKQARPSVIFLASDGGRNEEEMKRIRQNRQLIEESIDWNCTVIKQYEDHNIGLYAEMRKYFSLVFSSVDRCIFIEDDIIPAVSYFRFCAELLEKYKDDERISYISARNYYGEYSKTDTDYFFSRTATCSPFATWKRTYDNYYSIEYQNDAYFKKLMKNRTKGYRSFFREVLGYENARYYKGHEAASEFFLRFSCYAQNQLAIVPTRNLVSDHGAGEDATHSHSLKSIPREVRKTYFMEAHELEFPLKHPRYIIEDRLYEKKVIQIGGCDSIPIMLHRNLERIWFHIRDRDLFKWIKKVYDRERNRVIEG